MLRMEVRLTILTNKMDALQFHGQRKETFCEELFNLWLGRLYSRIVTARAKRVQVGQLQLGVVPAHVVPPKIIQHSVDLQYSATHALGDAPVISGASTTEFALARLAICDPSSRARTIARLDPFFNSRSRHCKMDQVRLTRPHIRREASGEAKSSPPYIHQTSPHLFS